jgi:hypothetical protein
LMEVRLMMVTKMTMVVLKRPKSAMRYVLPTLPVSGPSGKRARRPEAVRLAQHQGATRRSGSGKQDARARKKPAVAASFCKAVS